MIDKNTLNMNKKVDDIPGHAQHEKMEVLKIKGGCKEGTQMIAMV